MITRSFPLMVVLSAITTPAHAAVVMDQIGSTTTFTASNTSQDFENDLDDFDIAMVDDFTVTENYKLDSVAAAILPYTSDTDLSEIRGYRVEIFDSRGAASTSLTGNVYSRSILSSNAFVTSTSSAFRIVDLSIDLDVASGTYFLAVIPILDYQFGQTAIGLNGGGDAFTTNPGNGFGLGTTSSAFGLGAAYRVSGEAIGAVPEPATWSMMAFGFGVIGHVIRRRRRPSYARWSASPEPTSTAQKRP